MRNINADALKEEITQYFNDVMDINEIKTINTVISIIDNAPTVNKCDNCDLKFVEQMKIRSTMGYSDTTTHMRGKEE